MSATAKGAAYGTAASPSQRQTNDGSGEISDISRRHPARVDPPESGLHSNRISHPHFQPLSLSPPSLWNKIGLIICILTLSVTRASVRINPGVREEAAARRPSAGRLSERLRVLSSLRWCKANIDQLLETATRLLDCTESLPSGSRRTCMETRTPRPRMHRELRNMLTGHEGSSHICRNNGWRRLRGGGDGKSGRREGSQEVPTSSARVEQGEKLDKEAK